MVSKGSYPKKIMKSEKTKLPGFASWVIKIMLPDYVAHSAVGDYEEVYARTIEQGSYLKAHIWLWRQIFSAIFCSFFWGFYMLKNYIKVAFRNMRRHKGYSFINIAGLAVGMACAMLIFLWVQDELSYYRFHEDAEDIYTPLPEDFGEQIAEQIEAQIEAQMELMNEQLNAQFERLSEKISTAGLSEGEMERIMDQWRISSERASERAQTKMERAQKKLERKIEAARRKSAIRARAAEARQRGRKRGAWAVGVSVQPDKDREPVSEEERLMILRMLEQKKISPEEAEQLLAALEGQD